MNECVTDYYRCPEKLIALSRKDTDHETTGYFRFGKDAICFGSYINAQSLAGSARQLTDALGEADTEGGSVCLPFSPSEVIYNLYRELYIENWRDGAFSLAAGLYYLLRPVLPVPVRRQLQKLHLRDWSSLAFPSWPVDCSVDSLLEQLLLLSLKSGEIDRIPFIWFWPEGSPSCVIMTHDVESRLGRDFCSTLMDIDSSFGIKASFQVIPEERYTVSSEFLALIRDRGFEVAIHDLNHDGHLYKNRQQFRERAAKINSYGKTYGADGFRAGVLYRKQVWYEDLKFAYDMSVPNVAHLDPQRGGCCTVMPYFLGEILEIPVTMVQDYTLFNILNDYSTSLWEQQIEIVMGKHGLMSFIVHPDYVMKPRARQLYEALLSRLATLRDENSVWVTTPGDVNRWWRQRAQMRLVEDGQGWKIEGDGKERARIAYASVVDGRLAYSFEDPADMISLREHESSALQVSSPKAQPDASPMSSAMR